MEYYNDYGSQVFLISLVRFAFAIKSEPYLWKNHFPNVIRSLLIDCISMQIHVIENIMKSLLYETRKNMLVVNRTRIIFWDSYTHFLPIFVENHSNYRYHTKRYIFDILYIFFVSRAFCTIFYFQISCKCIKIRILFVNIRMIQVSKKVVVFSERIRGKTGRVGATARVSNHTKPYGFAGMR